MARRRHRCARPSSEAERRSHEDSTCAQPPPDFLGVPVHWPLVQSWPSSYAQNPVGELFVDPSGRHLFPVQGFDGSTLLSLLVSWTASATTVAPLTSLSGPGPVSVALAGANPLCALGGNGVMDVQLSTPLSA